MTHSVKHLNSLKCCKSLWRSGSRILIFHFGPHEPESKPLPAKLNWLSCNSNSPPLPQFAQGTQEGWSLRDWTLLHTNWLFMSENMRSSEVTLAENPQLNKSVYVPPLFTCILKTWLNSLSAKLRWMSQESWGSLGNVVWCANSISLIPS